MAGEPFKKWDLTRHWPATAEATVLSIDLDEHRLMGIALSDPFERLRVLGKPGGSFPVYDEAKKHMIGVDFVWLDLGLTARARLDGHLQSWDIDVGGHAPPALVHYRGQRVDLTVMKAADVRATFGADSRAEDSETTDTSLVRYGFPAATVEWGFDFGEDGRVNYFGLDPID